MSNELIRVEGFGDLARDPNTRAIVNINKEEIRAAREQKKLRKLKQQEEHELKAKVDKLESELGDIKGLLSQLIEKL